MRKDGSAQKIIHDGLDHPAGLAQDSDAIYFSERSGRIWRLRK